MPTGNRGQRDVAFSFARREATASAPSLLKPMRLITPEISGTRKSRGFGFPGCAFAVTVPISAKPKPRPSHAGSTSAFLSKPAARPTGFGNFNPKTSRSHFVADDVRKRALFFLAHDCMIGPSA